MKRQLSLLVILVFSAACQTAQPVSRLETTPRHDEWVELDRGGRMLHSYVVYPESSRKSGVVIVIHENRGLTDWVRAVADRLAENGYIAIAPDLLSGAAPGGGRTKDFPTEDAARQAIGQLPRQQVLDDLLAVIAHARKIPSANGKVAVGGFCWGGAKTWEIANAVTDLSGAFVFYGTGPASREGVARIGGPVFGFYGGSDERVNATIGASTEAMRADGKRFEPVIYEGAGHGFMRAGEEPGASEANMKARTEGWERWLRLLREVM